MKIGIDFHGVITDDSDFWLERLKEWDSFGHDIHLMTGARWQTFIDECCTLGYKVPYTTFFSISDFILKHYPDKVNIDNPDHPHIEDKKLWDRAKAEYARYHNLDLVIEDTESYIKYFTTPVMLYKSNRKKTT